MRVFCAHIDTFNVWYWQMVHIQYIVYILVRRRILPLCECVHLSTRRFGNNSENICWYACDAEEHLFLLKEKFTHKLLYFYFKDGMICKEIYWKLICWARREHKKVRNIFPINFHLHIFTSPECFCSCLRAWVCCTFEKRGRFGHQMAKFWLNHFLYCFGNIFRLKSTVSHLLLLSF